MNESHWPMDVAAILAESLLSKDFSTIKQETYPLSFSNIFLSLSFPFNTYKNQEFVKEHG
jgi:hypothetical protein